MEATQNNEEQRLCRICTSFYGTARTNFLCSKCHREESKNAIAAQEQTNQLEKLLSNQQPIVETKELPAQIQSAAAALVSSEELKEQEDSAMASPRQPAEEAAEVVAPKVAAAAEEQAAKEEPAVQTNKNKCWHCSKKVGIIQVACKCTYVFCPKHRHVESHNCTYDHFKANQERLTSLNPQIAHQKMVDRV